MPIRRLRPSRSLRSIMSSLHLNQDSTSPKDKGKQRALHGPDRPIFPYDEPGVSRIPISSLMEEALNTPLSPPTITSSLDTTFDRSSLISAPPKAHQPPLLRPHQPRLLSGLARSTLPSSSLTYASAFEARHNRSTTHLPQNQLGESSTAWKRSLSSISLDYGSYPDLDPATGLPLETGDISTSPENRSLHLQRTITGLLSGSTRQSSNQPGSRRSLSTSASQEDWASWATSFWSGNKGKVDTTLSEEDRADTVEEEREKHRRKYRTPMHPLVFCHGLLGFDHLGPANLPALQISHWRGIREVLESNGCDVLITRVPATASIKDRAAILSESIAEKYPGQQVNLIGHSMGGLDCRYLISELQPTEYKVVSLTTVSCPHRGSPFADHVIDDLIGRERLPSLLSLMNTLRLPDAGDGTAFNALGTRSMKEFNAQVVDDDDVKYFSWGASYEPGLLDTFRWSHSVILAKEGPNDGLVSVQSARWGEYRGTLVGVNHVDLVGWVNYVRYAISGWTGNPISFKPATFYLEVADYLAKQGY